MDCCSQEEEGDEFFESLDRVLDEEEDLASSSASSSAEFRSPLWISRYEIWKQRPRSIADRRGSLLAEMGVPTPPSSSSSSPSPSSSSSSPSSSSSSLTSSSSSSSCSNTCSSSSDSRLRSSVHSVGANILVHSNGACKPDLNNHSRASLDNNGIEDDTSLKNGMASIQRSTSSNNSSCSSFSSFTQCTEEDQIQTQRRSAVQAGGGGVSKKKGVTEGKSSNLQQRTRNRGEGYGKSKELIKEGMLKKVTTMDGEIGRDSGCAEELLESSSGLSPIMQEVWRRERVSGDLNGAQMENNSSNNEPQKKRRGWFKTLRELGRGSKERSGHGSGSEDRESSIRKGRKSGSTTDDSQEAPPQKAKRVKVHSHRKSMKEFTELHVKQEFQGHEGSVWSMKFSPDGRYLASAGQDRVVRVWEVILEQDKGSNHSLDSLEDLHSTAEDFSSLNCSNAESRNRNYSWKKASVGRKKMTESANFLRPPKLFRLLEKPKCSFFGHTEDILDLSWSKSQTLLSSSMDKTVRLWDISCGECLKIFTHNDYVTCIQFNPTDDRFFISGSLDGKVRIWSIQDHQVVNWIDLHEMVTAACYTPNGKGAVVGSYKGTCRIYKQEGNKLQLEYLFDVQSNKGKRSHGKKITGLQFVPGEENKVLITSSDSRIRIYDKTQLSSKFKGFRNAKSLICASFSSNGRYIVCASEDSRVCVWSHNDNKSKTNEMKYSGRWKDGSSSYESFHLKNVLVALPWPGISHNQATTLAHQNHSFSSSMLNGDYSSPGRLSFSCLTSSSQMDLSHTTEMNGTAFRNAPGNANLSVLERSGNRRHKIFNTNHHQSENTFSKGVTTTTTTTTSTLRSMAQIGVHGVSATWPEEKLFQVSSIGDNLDIIDQTACAYAEDIEVDANLVSSTSAWGLVIVTSGLNGEVMVFQNYGLPVRI